MAAFCVLACVTPACYAVDKSGVKANAISLPKGPGSIEGLGESFQPTISTGTAKYRVRLNVPPGTAGEAPDLALSYDGGSSNGPLGFGWRLEVPYIQRQTDKGIPRYGGAPDVFINEQKEELVPQADGYHFCKNEGAFVRYRQVDHHWEGMRPDGTLLVFGEAAGARLADQDAGHVFCWMLDKETDTNGNTISYEYQSFPGAANTNQVYIKTISYGPDAPPWDNFHCVASVYEDRPDWFEDCRAGFIVRTGKRLKQITMASQGPSLPGHESGDANGDGHTDYLDRKYVLKYEAHEHWSLLTAVQLFGADGSTSLPALTLGYTICDPPASVSASAGTIGSVNTPVHLMDTGYVDLVDLNGDGLPDILQTEAGQAPHKVFYNQGETDNGGSPAIQWDSGEDLEGDERTWNINLENESGSVAHLADMDADGLADLVYVTGSTAVYYFPNTPNSGHGNWGTRKQMSTGDAVPPSPFTVDNVKTADLDFDKRMDIIQSVRVGNGASYRIWFNRGGQPFASSVTVAQDSGYMLSDTGVEIADFNGDRVPDVIRIRPTSLEVTAGLGYGYFAPLVRVPLPHTLGRPERKRRHRPDLCGPLCRPAPPDRRYRQSHRLHTEPQYACQHKQRHRAEDHHRIRNFDELRAGRCRC